MITLRTATTSDAQAILNIYAPYVEQTAITKCAHFHKCGYKFGLWFDLIWMEKFIGEHK